MYGKSRLNRSTHRVRRVSRVTGLRVFEKRGTRGRAGVVPWIDQPRYVCRYLWMIIVVGEKKSQKKRKKKKRRFSEKFQAIGFPVRR